MAKRHMRHEQTLALQSMSISTSYFCNDIRSLVDIKFKIKIVIVGIYPSISPQDMEFNYFGQLSITRIKIVFGTIYNFDKHLIDCVKTLDPIHNPHTQPAAVCCVYIVHLPPSSSCLQVLAELSH